MLLECIVYNASMNCRCNSTIDFFKLGVEEAVLSAWPPETNPVFSVSVYHAPLKAFPTMGPLVHAATVHLRNTYLQTVELARGQAAFDAVGLAFLRCGGASPPAATRSRKTINMKIGRVYRPYLTAWEAGGRLPCPGYSSGHLPKAVVVLRVEQFPGPGAIRGRASDGGGTPKTGVMSVSTQVTSMYCSPCGLCMHQYVCAR
jgi:hypothetical protein